MIVAVGAFLMASSEAFCRPGNRVVVLKLEAHSQGVVLPVTVHAGSRREGLGGVQVGRLKIDVHAPPEKGKANKAVIALLAEQFGLAKSAIVLLSGEASPKKRLLLSGLTVAEVAEKLKCRQAAE